MRPTRSLFTALLLVCLSWLTAASATAQDDTSIQALEWRPIGPFNGGRGSSVVGHPTDPMVFWFGHSSGGLWKTEDAGTYWEPVGEGQFNYASVGAIASPFSMEPPPAAIRPSITSTGSMGDSLGMIQMSVAAMNTVRNSVNSRLIR